MCKAAGISLIALSLAVSSGVSAQQYVYPAKGQSAEQQQKDVADCRTWATSQTGYDPANPAPPPAATAPAPAPSGGRVRGAAAGATVAAITDNDVGKAAAVGAVAGGVAQRGAKRQAARQQQDQAAQQQSAAQANFQKAAGACLEGRGYTVK
jgi:hypothetical protein